MQRWLVVGVAAVIVVVGCWVIGRHLPLSIRGTQESAIGPPADDYIPEDIEFDIPALERPTFVFAETAPIFDDEIVIGVVVDDEPRAYLRQAFDDDPQSHVLYDRLGSLNVAVTHCDKNGCTRVLADPAGNPLDVRVGGWSPSNESMLLIISGERFAQSSPDIPLDDVEFVETSWGLWRQVYPDTLLYCEPPEPSATSGTF
jgi:hypothetical protein